VIGGVRGLDHEYELRRPRAAPAPAPNTPA
jgi:hypothetical protein